MNFFSRLTLILLSPAILAFPSASGGQAPQRLRGFSAASAEKQRGLEKRFLVIPSPGSERRFHRYLTAQPHPAASQRNNELATYVADTWKKQGLENVVIRRYDVLNSAPRKISLEMLSPVRYVAQMHEASYAVDRDTSNPQLSGGYLSMSASGEVTAPVVYAHGGNPEDYAVLEKNGIEVRGKIVLVRYSNPYSYRGFKVLTAEKHGAAAVLIYSDPAEDGYVRGKVFPTGPWGPETRIQRGSTTYDFIAPGDPLTPGWASVPGARRLPMQEAISLPKIIGTVLSWHDAKPLLEHMGGAAAPPSWQGGLPITYRFGGEATVHLRVDMDTSVKPNYVVEARITGSEFPDEWVLLGNHRDAWEFGAVDPSSGTAALLELSRSLGKLLKAGLRPRRTLILCSWDGEEVALTGSTEWGEEFADDLKQKLVAYLNVDSAVSGPDFSVAATPSLAPLIVDVSRSLQDPSGTSLYEAWRNSAQRKRNQQHNAVPVNDSNLVNTRILGDSDETVFLSFLCRPVIYPQFDGEAYAGVYHSAYDDFYWMNHFGDPRYRYHVLMSRLWGMLALRLANADTLPFDFEFYGQQIREFAEEIGKHEGAEQNLDLKPVFEAIADFTAAGREAGEALDAALSSGPLPADVVRLVNQALMQVEGNWMNPAGIPHRPWYKHVLFAKRFTYEHLELPGVTEALESADWPLAQEQAHILQLALEKNTALLRTLSASLKSSRNATSTLQQRHATIHARQLMPPPRESITR